MGAKQICAFAFVAAITLTMANARAADFRVLYSFCSEADCQDGYEPWAGLVSAGSTLYGTTLYGGAYENSEVGTIFSLKKDGTETVLYSFCKDGFPCPDGAFLFGGLLRDSEGNLYGATLEGGSDNCPVGGGCGTIFEFASKGGYAKLHDFCLQAGCPDGAFPSAALINDKAGNLYGTAQYGGGGPSCFGFPAYGCGAVFEMAPNGTETVLYGFCPTDKSPCADGADPFGGLARDKSGNLFGTTSKGGRAGCGEQGCGVVFEIRKDGKEKVLHAFQSGSDGGEPVSALLIDDAGNLYGTTIEGGGTGCGGAGCGTVFKIAPGGDESVLYRFCALTKCSDGAAPQAGLIADKQGNLYGTTQAGGIIGTCKSKQTEIKGCGTVFELAPDGTETVLHDFCSDKDCADGRAPTGTLLAGKNGALTGTADTGGRNGRGVAFELQPRAPSQEILSPPGDNITPRHPATAGRCDYPPCRAGTLFIFQTVP